MKKVFITTFLVLIIGIVFYKFTRQKATIPSEPNCETKLSSINETSEDFEGATKQIDFSDFPEAKTYYTRITETVKKRMNFAGYYSLISFGVGTDNVGFAIVNLKTGKVIAYNPVSVNYHLQNYGSYFVLQPVNEGQTREYYKIVNDELELVCSEVSTKDMYPNPPEDVLW